MDEQSGELKEEEVMGEGIGESEMEELVCVCLEFTGSLMYNVSVSRCPLASLVSI